MQLTGRLTLANMLRHTLLYKVRVRCSSTQQWRGQCAGELPPERVCPALLCETAADLSLKVKFLSHDTGWSGDIPIKECPKENVPWLVKVPSGDDMAFVSVWCRVSRASSDGRLLATFWPLFVLRSHLSLDTEVMITTELSDTTVGKSEGAGPGRAQTARGRGATAHLTTPGTTSARHTLTLQYKNIDCSVTPKGVPLHYGITQTSVFDECHPVQDIDDVIREIKTWLREWGSEARTDWPYSMVRQHWSGDWQPALLQPRTDITVPVVVTQHHHEGRWQVVVARDPCPQFVVTNATKEWLAVAQPLQPEVYDYQENNSKTVKTVSECEGARWICSVAPGISTHYTTPAYCARYPTPTNDADNDALAPIFLTFARATEDERSPMWCVPVGVVTGEQLVQLSSITVKLRVRTSPHSTLLELQHVKQHDISASDIRQRLVGSFSSSTLHDRKHIDECRSVERVNATDNLIEDSKCRSRRNNLISRGNFNVNPDLVSDLSENTIRSSNSKKTTLDFDENDNVRLSLCGLERERTRSVLAVGSEELDNSQVSIAQCLSEADQSSFKELLLWVQK
ncbi:PREDICTED: uncharacterized protein LOC106102547 [Papilio polytes]|uniref:uncharacterized protein LOC106102547 n=1 Tax=Papilio polytes TaxID=76194 RepID=UPI0006763BC9|nr:PREDICTED: uncharacterized protein LOC106102547 [Papilio polytes]